MSFSLNLVQLAGHLTKAPEFKAVGDNSVCSFSLAVNKRYKDKDGNLKDSVVYVDCESWGRTAELVAQYLTKGSAAYIQGALKLDQWTSPDGTKKQKLKVVADTVQFISTKSDADKTPAPPASEPTDAPPF